jgi:hypothetical protein
MPAKGPGSDDTARVTGELKPGDRVVALGAHLLHEGETVRLGGATQQVADAAKTGGLR